MGRRSINVGEQQRWIFNRVAASYRSRPAYPNALIERVSDLAGSAGGRLLDLGAGTGHLAVPLARRGHQVIAVEPAGAMLAELSAFADREQVRVEAVNASAERTGLPAGSFDLIVLADALQWIDPELAGREVARLLRPLGIVAVIEVQLGETAFMRELQSLFFRRNARGKIVRPTTLTHFLSPVARAQAPREERFTQAVDLDGRLLEELIQSLTFVGPALGPAALEDVVRQARELLSFHPGATWQRDLLMSWVVGRLR